LLLVLCLATTGARAQSTDILAGAPRTSIYVEARAADNEGSSACDWYRSASELIDDGDEAPATGCRVILRLRGIINREGARYFDSLVARLDALEHRPAAIVLDSRGGDADAAIFIARKIRDTAIFSVVPVSTQVSESFDAVCFSACVVIFSAGYERTLEFDVDGNAALPSRLGIHGPGQFDRDAGQYDTSANNGDIVRVSRRLKEYFRGIGVAESLVDDMFAVPFDEIRLLTREELVGYGLYR
jgi:hypothetical protein